LLQAVIVKAAFAFGSLLPNGSISTLRARKPVNHPDRFFSLPFVAFTDIIVPIGVIMENIKDTKSLGILIRQERKQQGLTQEQLAGVIGVGVRFLRELEAGKESCQIGRAMQVLAGLGLLVSVGRRQGPRS
jgi:y4mF family transcriptional regulator